MGSALLPELPIFFNGQPSHLQRLENADIAQSKQMNRICLFMHTVHVDRPGFSFHQ
jgi:hypothetical protein